jgi:5'-nucleotidase
LKSNFTVPLDEVEYILLDMDGTLLDKYFDDFFWEHLVPERYAEKHGITFGRAKEELMTKYRRHEGTLNWTDLDFWSSELALDIVALKEQIKHLIEVHPHVEDFLIKMQDGRKKIFLVTNAHYKSIELKFRMTAIGRYFDHVLSSFDAGYPKEDLKFWHVAEKILGFDAQKTLFIDDTEEVLKTAKTYGIRYLLFKSGASSRKAVPARSNGFLHISSFDALLS